MARKKEYPGGFRLTLVTARRLAVQEFGTAKSLEPEPGTNLEGFYRMELGNLVVSIHPDSIFGEGTAQRAVDSVRVEREQEGSEKKNPSLEEKTQRTKEAIKKIADIMLELQPDERYAAGGRDPLEVQHEQYGGAKRGGGIAVTENTADIRLPDKLVDYLQALDYEVAGLKVLHTHAMNAGLPQEKLEEMRGRFREKFQEYQLAKQELYGTYVAGTKCKRWWVDFQEGVLHLA